MDRKHRFGLYCGCCAIEQPLEFVAANKFCEENYITMCQLTRLARLGIVVMKQHKNKWFTAKNPQIEQLGFSFEYYLR